MTETHFLPTRRGAIAAALASAGAGAVISTTARAEPAGGAVAMVEAAGLSGDIHDFDFNVGTWTAVNRRLKQRWTATPQWDEFPGASRYDSFLGGMVSVDETDFPTRGFAGVTVRVFDPARRLWSIYWVNSKIGALGLPPVVGGFKGNIGVFYGDDTDDGQPVTVRFIRTKQPPDKDRWEQAFTRDGGKSWETNWTADFTRVKG